MQANEKRTAALAGALAVPALGDAELVERVRSGEVALFEVVIRRHNQRVYRAVRSILQDEAEVEDVMQEAYVSAFEHLARYDGRGALSTWLVRIAVDAARARPRRRDGRQAAQGSSSAAIPK